MVEHNSAEACPAELPNFCAQRHWAIFWLLIICSTVTLVGRIATVRNHQARGESAFFSANDRSRWCTVRSLADDGTYAIDHVIADGQSIHWDTIDKVRHVGSDGRMHYYSSKPTLFPTLVSYKYRAIKWLTGLSFADHPLLVTRVLLLLTNAIPWAIFLWFFAKFINSVPVRDWARYYLLACAGFATFLSTFSNSLNNHVPAAISVMVALYFLSQIWRHANGKWWAFAAVGLFSALAFAFELPAAAFLACAALVCLIRSPMKTLVAFAPAALLVVSGVIGTNYVAHGDWRPAYAHRSDGPVIRTYVADDRKAEEIVETLNQSKWNQLPTEFAEVATQVGIESPKLQLGQWPAKETDSTRWVVRDVRTANQMAIVRDAESSDTFQFRQWNNWYDYPGSYWLSSNSGKSTIDRGQASAEIYLFHCLFGHHGIFSLTPIWLMALAGMISLACGAKVAGRFTMKWLGWLAITVTVVVIGFYVTQPAINRNYGGVSSCLRWVLWLAPIWLASMAPIVDWLGSSRKGQTLCLILLTVSAVSAMVSMDNPWTHPWLYDIWHWTGLPR
jgi:hypothetical protein